MDLGNLLMSWLWNVGQRKKTRITPKFKDLEQLSEWCWHLPRWESLREIHLG